MICQLCKKNEADIVQKFDYDGIQENIAYCNNCIKEIVKFHILPLNTKSLKIYNTKTFFKNIYNTKSENIEFKNIKSKVLIEQPVFIKKILFKSDDNSKVRDTQFIIKRGLNFWKNEYEKAKNDKDLERMKAIENIINNIKKLL